MKRGEIWLADLPAPAGRRPVLLVSRDEAYAIRDLVIVAPITTQIRNIPAEVRLDLGDGMPKPCAINLDTLSTIPKALLNEHIGDLKAARLQAVDEALRFALGLE